MQLQLIFWEVLEAVRIISHHNSRNSTEPFANRNASSAPSEQHVKHTTVCVHISFHRITYHLNRLLDHGISGF
jgi:hypothetical protein